MSTWNTSQPTRIFGWTDILARWNAGQRGVAVDTVLNNLSSDRQFPAQHYFTYMNEEQDALKWFIYECVASSWMWNSAPRVEYIRVALDLIENVDSNFPVFPGSPAGTVREFLTNNLSVAARLCADDAAACASELLHEPLRRVAGVARLCKDPVHRHP